MQIRSILAAGLVALAAVPGGAGAKSDTTHLLNQGSAAFKAGNYKEAFRLWSAGARQGDPEAAYNLGLLYLNGQGVKQDDAAAAGQFMIGAIVDKADSQCNLGLLYLTGRGVRQDDVTAFNWISRAAEKGNAACQFSLGLMYDLGKAVATDKAKAIEWYRKSAENGYGAAQYNLGVQYANGDDVALDYVAGYKWISLAAANPKADDEAREKATGARDELAATLTPEQLAEAKAEIAAWKPAAGH